MQQLKTLIHSGININEGTIFTGQDHELYLDLKV